MTDIELTFHRGQRLGRIETLQSNSEEVLLVEEIGGVLDYSGSSMPFKDIVTEKNI